MKQTIDCFIPYIDEQQAVATVEMLREQPLVDHIYLLSISEGEREILGCSVLHIAAWFASSTMQQIAAAAKASYILYYTQPSALQIGAYALERMTQIAEDTSVSWIYADRYQKNGEVCKAAPVIDYQKGALRDDFDFGGLLLLRTEEVKKAVSKMSDTYRYAGLYDLRLHLSETTELLHINELLYTEVQLDHRLSGEKIFDYVDPRNRERQIEMEKACTDYLKRIGAYLTPRTREIDVEEGEFPVEATVVIPVRNRIRTIRDAIRSVLMQQTSFRFNLIVVDNHSTDGTSEAIDEWNDPRVIHILPQRNDLGIGGCWNMALHSEHCGRFIVQLDSDDVYSDEHTLQTIVDAFYEQRCAMVVGTYRMTNFEMQEIAPGIIDHKEWTDTNGHNNALRINGLGAPRAFFTPVLRTINFPNTSYGEDYAVGLRMAREYKIGRIYEVLYLCRRWEDNSDAALNTQKMNEHNVYKDRIRTWELSARLKMNV